MSITRADVADLRPGDVVEMTDDRWPGWSARGPVRQEGNWLLLGDMPLRDYTGAPARPRAHFTVVSRAPRPLYVNHDRTEPAPGDVVRDADNDSDTRVWLYADPHSGMGWEWVTALGADNWWSTRAELPARLRLLVDGTTGQVVP